MLLGVLFVGLLTGSPATAIINGTPDGNRHPAVGGLVSPIQLGDDIWVYCSGTLISSTVFLTAAHCGEEGERVGVTFDGDYEAGDKVHYGTFHTDPLYPGNQSDAHDIAVVVFDKPVKGITPARPARGWLTARTCPAPSGSPPWGTARTR